MAAAALRPVTGATGRVGLSWFGRLAQLAEHLVYTERVGGSSPSPPTIAEGKSMLSNKLRGSSRISTSRISPSRIRQIFPGFVPLLLGFVLSAAPPSGARAMDFHLQSVPDGRCRSHCPRIIVAEGQISNETPKEFMDFLRDNVGDRDLRTVVLIDSQGGYVVASMELGRIFRRIGAATVVENHCLSACVYAFMGGIKRVAPRGAQLGIHRMFADTSEGVFEARRRVYDDGSMAAMLMRYSSGMGVSRDLIRYAERISSGTIHFVTPAEMARWRLASRKF